MGLLDDLTDAAGNVLSGEGKQPGGLVEMALKLIKNTEGGGIQGLVEQFKGIGLGDTISSWIGTGANQAISGDQLANTFGMDKIQEIAGKLGVSASEASSKLAVLVPQLVDKLTPDGNLPSSLDQGLDMLKKKLLG